MPPANDARARQREQFTQLLLDCRARTETLYALPLSSEQMRQRKDAEFERLRGDYRTLRDSPMGWRQALRRLDLRPHEQRASAAFGLYEQWVPAFAELFKQSAGDWQGFTPPSNGWERYRLSNARRR